ncbi:MAG: hypothetical protein LBL31_06605 [Spirochaetaceae bacterium]|nr:hypothetical protein [Spirochaetaceae bacterium]
MEAERLAVEAERLAVEAERLAVEAEQLPQAAIASGVLRVAQNSKLKPHSGLSQRLAVEAGALAWAYYKRRGGPLRGRKLRLVSSISPSPEWVSNRYAV